MTRRREGRPAGGTRGGRPRIGLGGAARLRALAVAALAALLAASPAGAAPIRIKLGTAVPEDSPWHDVLAQMGQDWEKLSAGQVRLRIYPGGVLGEELDMVRRVRVGGLDAVAISSVGIHHVEPAVSCLQIPMMFDSYEELDFVRDRIAPKLEAMLEEKGFVVLNWGDAGWVHFFTKTRASSPADLRRMKLFISAGDAQALDLYKAAGMNPVPLALTDILPSLQTGLIDAIDVPPLLALLNQWFGVANHMVDVKWAPLIGATLIGKKTWVGVPADLRPALLKAGREAGARFRTDIRRLSEEAVGAMQKRGLTVVRVDDAARARWRAEAESAWPKLRGHAVPADLFDEVKRLREEVRAQRAGRP